MKRHIAMGLVVSVLAGCGGNLKSFDCSQDWYALGEGLALEGVTVRKFHDYKEHCGTQIGEAEKEAYIDGWSHGITRYCTYQKGYELGSTNQKDPEVCPPEIRPTFVQGYVVGRREFEEKLKRMERNAEAAQHPSLERKPMDPSRDSR